MKIVFNGREYDAVDQMPPEIRGQYTQVVSALGDSDGNGIPDVLERGGSSSVPVKESIVFNGREYKNRDELPVEVREALDRMPPPKPENVTTKVVVNTKTFPVRTTVSVRAAGREWLKTSGLRPAWLLVAALSVVVIILLGLWLSGIRPADMLRR
jgi:hypothetical protein